MDPGWVCSIAPILFTESAKSRTVIAATGANRRRFGHTDASPCCKGAKADALRFWRRRFSDDPEDIRRCNERGPVSMFRLLTLSSDLSRCEIFPCELPERELSRDRGSEAER
jgi:hypothetical protein